MKYRRMMVKEAKRNRAKVKRIPLQQWATLTFGPFAPRYRTLRRWAMDGFIVPRPKKVGWEWFVEAHAVYRDRIQADVFLAESVSVP